MTDAQATKHYNDLAAYYADLAAHARTQETASRYYALTDAAYNVAHAFGTYGSTRARGIVQRLASEASNGEVRSFYQAVRF